MLGSTTNGVRTIQNAWLQAAKDAYKFSGLTYPNTIKFAVAGDSGCSDDMLQTKTNSMLTGSWFYNSQQVWPPQ